MTAKKTNNLALLLKKAQAGDAAALNSLCKELERTLRGYFWQKFQNNTIVDDLCQETYVRLLRNVLLIRDETKLKSFVTKVALHVTQDYFRQKYRKKEEELETYYADEDTQKDNLKQEIADDQSEGIIDRLDLESALSQLPAKSRDILVLKTQGYDYEEISDEVGLSVSGVKMQVKRSLEQLRIALIVVTFLMIGATILVEHIM